MREVDRRTISELGIPVAALMESAGRAVAVEVDQTFADRPRRRVIVVCGRGNNGGDGLVAARHLDNRGWAVTVVLLGAVERLAGIVRDNAEVVRRWGIPLIEVIAIDGVEQVNLEGVDVIVDAIFGTGFKPPAGSLESAMIQRMVKAHDGGTRVAAVDLPSGLDADSGHLTGAVVSADLTVSFAAAKLAHVLPPGEAHCGRLVIADIGIPRHLVEVDAHSVHLITGERVASILPRRPRGAHKGVFGHLLIIAGSRGKSGAAVLCARAALRSGVGLVTVATPASCLSTVAGGAPEAMTEPLSETDSGAISLAALERLMALASSRDAVALGPGLGTDPATVATVRRLVADLRRPIVLDADALNALAGFDIEPANSPTVATPHPGEAARLLRRSTTEILANRLGACAEIAATHRWTTVLKGYRSIVASPDGTSFINPTGNSGMATGGTGDVLTGMVGALLAQGVGAADAAIAATYLHGLAGDRAAAISGETSLVASDLIEAIAQATRAIADPPDAVTEDYVASQPEETEEIGRALAAHVRSGGVVFLRGPLGAGKTLLARALFAALGVDPRRVNSPTFQLINCYRRPGGPDLPLFHVDLYRIDREEQLDALGLEEILDSPGIIVIEWPELLSTGWVAPTLTVDIEVAGDVAESRRLHVQLAPRSAQP